MKKGKDLNQRLRELRDKKQPYPVIVFHENVKSTWKEMDKTPGNVVNNGSKVTDIVNKGSTIKIKRIFR